MPRPIRIQEPGAIYHVYARGNARAAIFIDDRDRHNFLYMLAATVRAFGWLCHAYCLMGNHFHLIIETPLPNLSRGMHHLDSRYAQRFNWRHGRVGHVFQNRFKSSIIQRERYFLEACRYVVLNPVRAGLVRGPGDWQWSSFSATVGAVRAPSWLHADTLLAHFAKTRGAAREAYRRFVFDAIGGGALDERFKEFPSVVGDEGFVETQRPQRPHGARERREASALSSQRPHGARKIKDIVFVESAVTRPALAEVIGVRRRFGSGVRRFACKVRDAVALGHSKRAIAEYLRVDPSQISRLLRASEEAEK